MRKYDTPQCKSLKATHDTVQITFLKLLLFCRVVSSAADMTIHMHQIQIQDVARTWFSTLDPIDTGRVTEFHARNYFPSSNVQHCTGLTQYSGFLVCLAPV